MILFRAHVLQFVDVLLGLAIIVCAKLCPTATRNTERWIFRLANHRVIAAAAVGMFSLAGSSVLVLLNHVPHPHVHDEFSYLLAADTFAAGRLSNPTHPMWMHFETFHVIQKPTYVSKFLPAQGLILATGQALFGHPIVGVWLSGALACGAICWMLQGWFRPSIAAMGALLCAAHIGITTYWTQSYWGGMMAALGGALVYGSVVRLRGRPLLRYSLVLAAGLAILSASRPFEGAIVSIPAIAYLFSSWFRSPGPVRQVAFRNVFIPLCLAGVATLSALAYYNSRQTGNAFVTAYQVYSQTYQPQPIFRWGTFSEPVTYHNEVMKRYYGLGAHDPMQVKAVFQKKVPTKFSGVATLWKFYVGWILTVPLVVAFLNPSRIPRLALLGVLSVIVALLFGSYYTLAHYAAPMTGPLFVMVTYGWRRLRLFARRAHLGLLLARVVVAISMVTLASRMATAHLAPAGGNAWAEQRAAIQRQLDSTHEDHLVIVRYAPYHDANREWVYNKAEIDRARVVWAREMDADENRKLIAYFPHRQVWLLEPDQPNPKLLPYTTSNVERSSSVGDKTVSPPRRP